MKPDRGNALDLAILLLALSIVGALIVHVTHPSPLRRILVDEAERHPLLVTVSSPDTFLASRLHPGDAQRREKGSPGIELLSFSVEKDRLEARFRVQARKWRGWWQYGDLEIMVGERFEFFTKSCKFIGTVTDVHPE